ncbi:hypothetical protein ABPG75_004317 [Micractinium tetrahymenae]
MARGFYTEEVRQGGERLGFDVVTLDGRRGPLARAGAGAPRGGPTVGKYAVDVTSFERLALPELRPQQGAQLYCVDEVGKMELLSPAFLPAVTSLLDAAPVVLGTLPVARLPQASSIRIHGGLQHPGQRSVGRRKARRPAGPQNSPVLGILSYPLRGC